MEETHEKGRRDVKRGYLLDRHRPMTMVSAGFMLASAALRLIWWARWPAEAARAGFAAQVALPVGACVLFAAAILLLGRRALWVSAFPAFLGVLFFILKAQDFVWWHRLLCTILYLAVAVLYGLTAFGVPIRKLLLPLFGLPLAFHLLVEDLFLRGPDYTAGQWLQEISVLCIMTSLLTAAMAMKPREQPAGKAPALL